MKTISESTRLQLRTAEQFAESLRDRLHVAQQSIADRGSDGVRHDVAMANETMDALVDAVDAIEVKFE